ncbi:hypothetical protein GCM10010145_04410 [Streptomyces ruber]|uniref:Uncharacterized protein n=2 Tax=Streptomyces TaxID=1883 RepID=A0A918EQM4_9ACTN|nr:hypothetical protein [Streptomyces ruber]GGQ39798.1 hypothetical protein GCM10010145_04410 [Streptomyces ruber]
MLRHDVQPGKLVAGLFLCLTAVAYVGDAGGAWEIPWFVAVPMVTAGLCLAGATAFLAHAIRRRRTPRPRCTKHTRTDRAAHAEASATDRPR